MSLQASYDVKKARQMVGKEIERAVKRNPAKLAA
jgi:hypothetical protein